MPGEKRDGGAEKSTSNAPSHANFNVRLSSHAQNYSVIARIYRLPTPVRLHIGRSSTAHPVRTERGKTWRNA